MIILKYTIKDLMKMISKEEKTKDPIITIAPV
jgi:hypothetical protein